jgi:hypothetical protein
MLISDLILCKIEVNFYIFQEADTLFNFLDLKLSKNIYTAEQKFGSPLNLNNYTANPDEIFRVYLWPNYQQNAPEKAPYNQ